MSDLYEYSLRYDKLITPDIRGDAHEYALSNILPILDVVMHEPGLEPLSAVEIDPHDEQDLVERLGAVSVERAVAHTPNIARKTLTKRNEGADEIAVILLGQNLASIASGEFDYAAWEAAHVRGGYRRNLLGFMGKVGLKVSPLESLGGLRDIASAIVDQHRPRQTPNDVEIMDISIGYSKLFNRRTAHSGYVKKPQVVHQAEAATAHKELPLQNPQQALELIRSAMCGQVIKMQGRRNLPRGEAYRQLMSAINGDAEMIRIKDKIGDAQFSERITYVSSVINKYCIISGSPVHDKPMRDKEIIKTYLLDMLALKAQKLRKPDVVALYRSPEDMQRIIASSQDIAYGKRNVLIIDSLHDIEGAFASFRRNVADAKTRFADTFLDDNEITVACAYFPNSYIARLEAIVDKTKRAEESFADNPLVTKEDIRYFSRNISDSIVDDIEVWLNIRAIITDLYRGNKYIFPSTLAKLTRSSPGSRMLGDGQDQSKVVAYYQAKVEAHLQKVHEAYSLYKNNPDVDEAVIVLAAKNQFGNPSSRIEHYLTNLKSMRRIYNIDPKVDESVMKYYSMYSVATKHVIKNIENWRERYTDLSLEYVDYPDVDDEILRYVALMWPSHPSFGIDLAVKRRRSKGVSDNTPVTTTGLELGDVLADPAPTPDVAYEQKLGMSDEAADGLRSQISGLLSMLENDVERAAVQVAFDLWGAESIDTNNLCVSLGIKPGELIEYVESTILPKLQAAAQNQD